MLRHSQVISTRHKLKKLLTGLLFN